MKDKPRKKKELPEYTRLVLHTSFTFIYLENATNLIMALVQAGYFPNMVKTGQGYQVNIYKRG